MKGISQLGPFLCLLLLATAGSAQTTGDVHLSLTLASDYKHNGLSQTASGPAIRLAADWEHESGFFAGGALGNVDFAVDERLTSERDLVVNLYIGYSWRRDRWSAAISATRYDYPGPSAGYDYTQLAATVSYRGRYHLTYTRSNDFYSIGQSAEQYRAGISRPWIHGLEASVNAGRFRSDERFDIGYSFFDIGLSRILGRFALDLRYHDDTYDRATAIGETGDDRWVFSISRAISPGRRRAR